MLRRLNIFKWIGYLFAPIEQNGAFFVFMFVLGWLCTQVEIPLHVNGAEPYELSALELFFDLYIVCVVLTLIPRKVRIWVKALLYILFYGVAIADMYCYVRFESTLTPTMLMLVGETNSQEAGEFLAGYLSWDVLTSKVGYILLILLAHVLWTLLRRGLCRLRKRLILPVLNPGVTGFLGTALRCALGIGVAVLMYHAYDECWTNKEAIHRLMTKKTIGEVEHQLTLKPKAELYLPIYRLVFSLYANSLASHQLETLVSVKDEVVVDSCSFRVPNIVLVIGESYNKHHSQLYGYKMPTTPRQLALAKEGSLIPFTDVVAPWNLTSYVFKQIMSLYTVGDPGDWCDYPLFPEVFRQAGYHVTFITNQFLPEADEAVYDFSGGFFLNHPELSKAQFDTRNTKLFRFDEGVLDEYERLKKENTEHNLVILHLMGSHLMYKSRYPQATRKHLRAAMYDRPDLSNKQKLILADYDNSVLYNDSIVAEVTRKFADKDALVIYMPDHAEEIFNGRPYIYGRMHAAAIDYRLAREEFEIPFWIWGSPKYIENHPYGWQAIKDAKDRPLMTDRLAHLLLYLGGISCKYYHDSCNVISPDYDTRRPRILKGVTDYDQLKKK
ncbi:phosphoethanolamine transferase [Prevotella sp. lc2012]|uniref:sulfatase-like hydrolase/transferase n=1 Tax=Prevotella sp. lc2012 TaxID=1761886 RepID=UPI00089440F5|nr:phosphoethanolamine transferase [Prevotella sp. lc2012]SEE30581.1 heptose-I-phosphate ethanolaminephosphotransferase [Prevotella sp. lc2012]